MVAWLLVTRASGRAVLSSGVGCARAEHRELQVLAPLSTRTLPSTGAGGFRSSPRAPWPGAGREGGEPGLSLLLTQPPAVCLSKHKWQQQFNHPSGTWGENPVQPVLRASSELCLVGWVQCRVLHNRQLQQQATAVAVVLKLRKHLCTWFTVCACQFNSLFMTKNKSSFILSI